MTEAVHPVKKQRVRIFFEYLRFSGGMHPSVFNTANIRGDAPSRLVEQMGQSGLTEDELREKLEDLEIKRSKLKEAGLLDKDEDISYAGHVRCWL